MTQIRKKNKNWFVSLLTGKQTASSSHPRHRKASSSATIFRLVFIMGIVLSAGFLGGWFLSGDDVSAREDETPDSAVPKPHNPSSKFLEQQRQKELLKRQQQRNIPRLLVYQVPSEEATTSSSTKPIGVGHFMQGLLAAHLLAREFNRTVCVEWPQFHQGFQYKSPETLQKCQTYTNTLSQQQQQHQHRHHDHVPHKLSLWTERPLEQGVSYELTTAQKHDPAQKTQQLQDWAHHYTTDECSFHAILESRAPDHAVVLFQGNTYPRWHAQIPPHLLEEHYTLRFTPHIPAATDILIHLRAPPHDHDVDLAHANEYTADKYRGLDEKTLFYMGHKWEGPQHTLITNRPDLYAHRFQECCAWNVLEDAEKEHNDPDEEDPETSSDTTTTTDDIHALRTLWRDWYALYKAPTVYHSNSELARSATHWNPHSQAYQLNGLKKMTIHGEARDMLSFDRVHYHWDEWQPKAPVVVPLKQRIITPLNRQGYHHEEYLYLQNCPDSANNSPTKKKKGIRGFFQNRQQKQAAE